MKKIYFILFCTITLTASSQVNKCAAYQQDFNVFITSLRELHPALYKNITKENFDKNAEVVNERLKSVKSDNEAIYIIQEFLFKIKDSHVGNVSIYHGELGVTKALPISIFILDGQLYIKGYDAAPEYNGTKILSINGTKSELIIDSLNVLFPLDGDRKVISYFLQPYFNTYYGAFCSQTDTFIINTEKRIIKAPAAVKGSALYEKLMIKKNWAEYFGNNNGFVTELNDNYGYFRCERLDSKKIESSFLDMIKEMNKRKIKNFVLDLRYNNGGDALIAGKMASYIVDKPFYVFENVYTTNTKRPKYLKNMESQFYFKHRHLKSVKNDSLRKVVRFEKCIKQTYPNKDKFQGQIYVLTGSITLSASSMLCSYIKGQSNVTFVGSETSGSINYLCAASHCVINFPSLNSTFSFGVQLLEIKKNSSKTELPIGLIPEHKIDYTVDDILNKRDKEIEWIKDQIKNTLGEDH
jgi:hypothetical protein